MMSQHGRNAWIIPRPSWNIRLCGKPDLLMLCVQLGVFGTINLRYEYSSPSLKGHSVETGEDTSLQRTQILGSKYCECL